MGVDLENEYFGGQSVTTYLAPDSLSVDGASVECDILGFTSGGANPLWDMTLKDGALVIAEARAYHASIEEDPQAEEDSKLTYDGSSNRYTIKGNLFQLMSEVIRQDGNSYLEVSCDGVHDCIIGTEIVRREDDQTTVISFDVEGVTLKVLETGSGTIVEAIGPDYDDNEHDVLFTDSPCVRRFEEVVVRAGSGQNEYVFLLDGYQTTPISGATSQASSLIPDALYVVDLTVASGAVLQTGDQGGANLNIYYTGTLSNNGSIFESDGSTAYTPIQLSAALYGDFDHDSVADDAQDVARFNDAFPCDVDSCDEQGDEYDPLVDWNCDGVIDCDDRAQFLTNWPNASNLEDDNCP